MDLTKFAFAGAAGAGDDADPKYGVMNIEWKSTNFSNNEIDFSEIEGVYVDTSTDDIYLTGHNYGKGSWAAKFNSSWTKQWGRVHCYKGTNSDYEGGLTYGGGMHVDSNNNLYTVCMKFKYTLVNTTFIYEQIYFITKFLADGSSSSSVCYETDKVSAGDQYHPGADYIGSIRQTSKTKGPLLWYRGHADDNNSPYQMGFCQFNTDLSVAWHKNYGHSPINYQNGNYNDWYMAQTANKPCYFTNKHSTDIVVAGRCGIDLTPSGSSRNYRDRNYTFKFNAATPSKTWEMHGSDTNTNNYSARYYHGGVGELDSSGNIYYAYVDKDTSSNNWQRHDGTIGKLNSAGTTSAWQKKIDFGENVDPVALFLDSNNDVIVMYMASSTGTSGITSSCSSQRRHFLIKMNGSNGSIIWSRKLHSATSFWRDRNIQMSFDSNDDIYIVGNSRVVILPGDGNFSSGTTMTSGSAKLGNGNCYNTFDVESVSLTATNESFSGWTTPSSTATTQNFYNLTSGVVTIGTQHSSHYQSITGGAHTTTFTGYSA